MIDKKLKMSQPTMSNFEKLNREVARTIFQRTGDNDCVSVRNTIKLLFATYIRKLELYPNAHEKSRDELLQMLVDDIGPHKFSCLVGMFLSNN